MGTENIKLGTCTIEYNGQALGLTSGGVEVTVETNTYQSTCDQYGDTIVKEIITGRNITVAVPMVETTLENLARIMPGSELITESSSKKKVTVKTSVGTDLRTDAKYGAKRLVLKPIGVTGELETLTIPLAATPGGINFAYMLDQERVYQADFKGYPDDNGLLFVYGDFSAS